MTKRELDILRNAAINPFFFAHFIKIVHPIKGQVPFDLYKFQKRTLFEFLYNQFTVVLKARQMGLTELIAMYCLWLALFHPHKNIQIVSLKDRVAKKVLRRIKFMYKHLPAVLKTPIVNGRASEYGTSSEMVFGNGSSITSVPTTPDAVRSEAVTLLVLDEAAILKYATEIWAAAFPALSTGGSAIINSTPYGVGGFFFQTWSDALYGGNGFKNVRIDWYHHPDRDKDWYQRMKNALGAKRTAQEIDCDFLASGDTFFDLVDIKAIEDDLYDKPIIESRYNGNLLIYELPIKGVRYFIGADVSTGRAKDYSAFSIMKEDGTEVGAFKGRIPTSKLKNILLDVGKEYNYAKIGAEGNDVGEAVVSGLQEANYPNQYYTERLVKERGSTEAKILKIPGWYTTGKNRSLMLNLLETDIREDIIEVNDPFFVNEAYTFIYDNMNRPVAMNKGEYIGDGAETYSDDSIIAKAITNFMRRGRQAPVEISVPK